MPTAFIRAIRPARALLALAVSLLLAAAVLAAPLTSADARPKPDPCHYPPVPDCS